MFSSNVINYVLKIDFENKIKNKKTFYSKISRDIKKNLNINISRHTISNWIKSKNDIYKNRINREFLKNFHNKIHLFNKPNTKINKINLLLVSKYIDFFPLASRNDIRTFIFKDCNILLSLNSISKIIKKINYSRKKVKYHVVKNIQYINELNNKRKNFISFFKNKVLDKFIFIDETGFNFKNKNTIGLSKKGCSINMPDKVKSMKNINMIMAINSKDIIDFDIYDNSIDSVKFYDFINKIINNLKDTEYTFIFDNVSFHHNKDTLQLIKNTNNNYLFTPPYSPNLNPIENVFGIIKSIYRKKYKNKNLSETKYSTSEQIIFINDSILDFITIYFIDIDKIINRALTYSYEDIEKQCLLLYK